MIYNKNNENHKNRGSGHQRSYMFKDYTAAHTYRDNVFEKFRNELHFNVVGQRRPFAGTGNIFIRNRFETIAVGEASGFQDFMFGFGMRYAIQSGYLAAMSILNGSDYSKAIQENIHPLMKASISNRLIYKPLGRYGYDKLAEIIAKGRTKENIHRLYSPQWWHPLLYPFAHIVFQENTRDPQEA